MPAIVCPTITAKTKADYEYQVRRVGGLAKRIHIDISDGVFSPVNLVAPSGVWWPHPIIVDIHFMVKKPENYVDEIIRRKPHLIIVHAEADGSYLPFAQKMHDNNIKVGVALLPETKPELIVPAIKQIDHVLIFSGDLGRFGGKADFDLLEKIKILKKHKPSLEIGWDGGINDANIQKLKRGGVDVLNVGGYLQNAHDPMDSYQKLESLLH